MIGDALWPNFFSKNNLIEIKRTIGDREFNSLYQQRPSSAEGSLFNRSWWHYYKYLPYDLDCIIQSWDNCGYTCDRKCDLPIMECIEKHYVKDCEHDFTGPWKELKDGGSVTCKHCGMTACGHDMICGP